MLPPRLALALVLATAAPAQTTVEFNRDVRPILSDHCFACHGPDTEARKAKLRLDTRAGATAPRRRGAAIVPGDSASSLLVQRIHHPDPDERMPPPRTRKPLTPQQRDVLEQWIASGAPWQGHWSFEPLRQPPLRALQDDRWARNEIDHFLAAEWAMTGGRPARSADARTLVRRLHLDLLGLPPDPDVVDAHLRDPSDAAYEQLVDRLLASEHHAERLTMYWLDLVRYADSVGIHGDQPISMSPYRDWVIHAFHENMPFDVFTQQQLAGDLLPGATLQQQVASGYNRLNMKTAEGGAQEQEYLAKYAADRVRTTAGAWLGATLGCAECHDHKFDPFTTRDFYRFSAFFADLDHKGFYGGAHQSGDWGPKVTVPTPLQARQLAELEARIEAAERRLATSTPELTAAQRAWEAQTLATLAAAQPATLGDWRAIGPFASSGVRAAHDAAFGPEQDRGATETHGGLAWRPEPGWRDGEVNTLRGDNSATYVYREIESPTEQPMTLSLGSDDSIKVWLDGDVVLDHFVTRGVQPGQETVQLALAAGTNRLLMKICNGGGGYGFVFATAATGPPTAIAGILDTPRDQRSAEARATLAEYYRGLAPLLAAERAQLTALGGERAALAKTLPTSLVSRTRDQPRPTRVLPRGNWLDASGEVVRPGVPGFLATTEAGGQRQTRLDLATWITSEGNPLTARVFVNRMWRLLFGRGLCATLDDVGSQGAWPRHLELLDWLACEFRRDWDVRRLLKTIVMSSAYRQASHVPAAVRAQDPENRAFARQGRFRHDAELVRDQALAISGLLVADIGGPSVKPYQPAGYWAQLNFPTRTWQPDEGPAQYRRGLYTHWQRTFLHPSLLAFDAPTREECTAARPRSNTPLQALALLNDPTYVEAARVFAAAILREGGDGFDARLDWAFRRALARRPTDDERATLAALVAQQRTHYEADLAAARALTTTGLAPVADDVDAAELAAWTATARVLLNLHETITRS